MANHGRSSISVHIKAGGALQEERAPANRAVEQLRGPLDAPGGVQRCRETASVEALLPASTVNTLPVMLRPPFLAAINRRICRAAEQPRRCSLVRRRAGRS